MLKGTLEPGRKIATERSREQERHGVKQECDSAGVMPVWGREGAGMITIPLAVKDKGKREVVSSFLLRL